MEERALLETTCDAPRGPIVDRTLLAPLDAAAPVAADVEALATRWVGRFAVLRTLGRGGMGIVYAAYDEQLERRVALKLLLGGDKIRLMREAQALARLSHPHVVQIYEVGEFEGHVFVAMEYIEGPTIAAWLAARPRSAAEILGVFSQAARGLAAAHECGLVHRDFKPTNAIVGDDGRVRVLDFGLARADGPHAPEANIRRIAEGDGDASGLLHGALTVTGAVLGTPAYMSPEQHSGMPVDARSDQFSLCAALYEALYDQRPFAGETMPELAANVIEGQVRPPPPRPDVPPHVAEALLRGLEPRPGARWPSLAALLDALAGEPAPARGRALLPYAASAIAGALALVVYVYTRADDPAGASTADMAAFSVVLALLASAAYPLVRRRLGDPHARMLLDFAVLQLVASTVIRGVLWRAGQDLAGVVLAETLAYAVGYAAAAVVLRAPWIAAISGVLVLALLAVVELGAPPRLLSLSWVAAVLALVLGPRRER